MAEYIEREALITKFKKMELGEHGLVERLFADGVYAVIAAFPAADVAPVVHGRWEIVVGSNGNEYMVCTCCRVSQGLTGVFTYCPNCGCRMDGGDDE